MNTLSMLFGSVAIASTFRVACPLLIAGMGGCFCHNTGTFNFAYECFMLSGAFFAAFGSHISGSYLVGALFAMGAGALLALLYGLFVFRLKADPMIISLALNMGAWALTTLMLYTVFGTRGQVVSPTIINYPKIHLGFLDGSPTLSYIMNDNIFLVYFAYVLVIVAQIVMYRTRFGLRLRGIGINSVASQTVGVKVDSTRWATLLIMGISTGLAGSYLPMSGLSTFSENMTAGRGYLVFAAILCGNGNPLKTALTCIIFAYTDALSTVLTAMQIPTQLVSMLPYLAVIVTMFIGSIRNFNGKPKISAQN